MSLESYDLARNEIENALLNRSKILDLSSVYIEGVLRPPKPEEQSRSMRYANRNLFLEYLPSEISELVDLEILIINGVGLTQLGDELSALKKLKILKISDNNLESIPDKIFEFNNLIELDLSNNKLSKIPQSIFSLKNLKTLRLKGNKILNIPTGIGRLKNLNILDLTSNMLEQLPFEITNLKKISSLLLGNNRIEIPEEILHLEPNKILNYIKDLNSSDRKPLHEAKVIFLGNGNVGKTSLIKRLIKNQFDSNELKTNGISITDWEIKRNDDEIKLHIWDFGGQEIMHATHKFFMTKRSIYVLVINPRVEDNHGESDLEYWVKLIRSYAANVPIIVVINKCETHPVSIEVNSLSNKYPEIKSFVETSCAKNIGIDLLKTELQKALNFINHIDDQLPISYFKIKDELVKTNEDYIEYNEYERICNSIIPEMDGTSKETLVSLLHDLGIMLNFRKERLLKDTQVLNPEWVTNGVYQIITSDDLIKRKGVITLKDIKNSLDSSFYQNEKEQFFIIDIMNSFELSYKFPGIKNHYFVVPGAFSKDRPLFKWETKDKSVLRFQYHYDILPNSIITRFMVKMHRRIREKDYWRNGIVLQFKNCEALIRADNIDKVIFIEVVNNGTKIKLDNKRTALEIIRDNIENIHSQFEGLKITRKIPIDEEGVVLVNYDDLLIYEEAGEEDIFVPKLMKKIKVTELLFGVDSKTYNKISDIDAQQFQRISGFNVRILKNWISQGKLDKAFLKIIGFTEDRNIEITNTLYTLFSRYKRNDKERDIGQISDTNYNIEKNQIIGSLLKMVDQIAESNLKIDENNSDNLDLRKLESLNKSKNMLEKKKNLLLKEIEKMPASLNKIEIEIEIENIEKEIQSIKFEIGDKSN